MTASSPVPLGEVEAAADRVRQYVEARDLFYGREALDDDVLDTTHGATAGTAEGPDLTFSDLRIIAARLSTSGDTALREAVVALTYASDDGTEYEHNGHADWEGEPECPGCWAKSLRALLNPTPPTVGRVLTSHAQIVAGMVSRRWGGCAICGAARRPGPEGGDDLICGDYPEHYAVSAMTVAELACPDCTPASRCDDHRSPTPPTDRSAP